MMRRCLCLAVGFFTICVNVTFGAVWHIDARNGSDDNDGASPHTAWRTMEHAALKEELAIDEKWYTDAKKANDVREMRNAVRELKSVRRRILFRHPDLQFKRLLAVQRGLPFSQESGTTDQYAGRWSRPGPGLVAIDNWQEAPHKTVLLKDKLPWGTVLNFLCDLCV